MRARFVGELWPAPIGPPREIVDLIAIETAMPADTDLGQLVCGYQFFKLLIRDMQFVQDLLPYQQHSVFSVVRRWHRVVLPSRWRPGVLASEPRLRAIGMGIKSSKSCNLNKICRVGV
jgi:hypothetical protein